MEEYEKNIVPHIEAIYETFTSLEKNIADFLSAGKEKEICQQRTWRNSFMYLKPLCPSLQKSAVTKDTVNFYSAMNKREHQ